MAEFKIGRLRFTWAGEWVTDKFYNRDAIVLHEGKSYVCLVPHTSADFYVALNASPIPYWDLQIEGKTFKGAWTPGQDYSLGNIVTFGGTTYYCTTNNTSSASFATDEDNWDIISTGDNWTSDWAVSTDYGVGDIVRYGGNAYRCTANHLSASTASAGLEADAGSWAVYVEGIQYRGVWSPNTQYKLNELVKVDADIWKCITAHPAQATFNDTYFEEFLPGEQFRNTWDSSVNYLFNDVISYGGYDYISLISNNLNNIPSTTSAYWDVVTTGYAEEGDWDNVTTYPPGSVVRRGGQLYIAVSPSTGADPTNSAVQATYEPTGSSGTTLKLTGSYINTITVGQIVVGPGFNRGQAVVSVADSGATIILNDAPDSTPGSDLLFVGVNPNWTLLIPGVAWEGFWSAGRAFTIGDLVLWQNATYRCIQTHQSLSSNSPVADTTNTYWVIYLLHARNNAAHTVGDITTYNNNAYTSVSIGPDEYALRSTNSLPAWRFINRLPSVYYVSETGTDDATYGITLDKPWRTIKYACDTLLAGTINQRAAYLINANKDYIIEEMYQWMVYQVANEIAPYTSASTFDEDKTRRDAKFIVDAVTYDLTRGGNSQTVAATLAYFANSTTLINTTVADEKDYITSSLTYLGEVIQAVISNVPPASEYQLLNSVPVHVDQVINTSYFAETGTYTPADLSTVAITSLGLGYVINGTVNVTLNLVRGNTYTFPVTAPGHELWFQTTGGIYNPATVYTNGVLGQGVATGTITFTVPFDAPNVLYYQCQRHPRMYGSINIYDASVTIVDVPAASTQIDTLLNIVVTAIDDVSTAAVPVSNAGLTATINVKTGTYSEILPITIPANVAVVGDELRGVTVQPATSYTGLTTASTSNDNTYTVVSTNGLEDNMPVQFAGTAFGGASTATTYYIVPGSITDTSFSISTSVGGAPLSLSIALGVMYVYAGDALKDMFYMRNGSGLRNVTLTGLLGTLSEANSYGTQRPTGGAFTSLDPGDGPDDTTAWIYRRSPYVQNVTTFGQGCTGLKIDGTLHNGGNKSIVANDFTHIISDGVGAWCTGSGALTELISVFSYYCYASYFAEDGGRIRAANGNASYGTYGVIAEGYDTTEVPLTGNVYNKSSQVQASVQSSLGLNAQLLKLQYANAGQNYTTTTTNLLTYSNNFINAAWTADGNVTFQQNTTAPTGYAEAWTLTTATATAGAAYIEEAISITPSGASYTALNGTNISGSGSGATFDVIVTGQNSYSVTVNTGSAGGSGYVVGNQIKILGSVLGGVDVTNDLIITVSGLSSSSINAITTSGVVPTGSSKPYLISLYVKKGTSNVFDIYGTFSGTTAVSSSLNFNFNTGIATPSISVPLAGSIAGNLPTSYGVIPLTNDWYRVWFTVWDKIGLNDTLTVRLYPGGYASRTSGVYSNMYGAQVQSDVSSASLSFYLETQDKLYTSYANYEITGSGAGAVIQSDEIRSRSVFETRVTSGGTSYLTASNNAQGGTSEYVILAGSDINPAASYNGMRVFINSGTGTGQYGYISSYDYGSKVAQVLKESFDELTITATSSSGDVLTLGSGSTAQLYVNQPVQFLPTYYSQLITNTARGSVTVTDTYGGTVQTLIASSTANLQLYMPVTFSGTTFGSITTGFTYYVSYIDPDGVTFQVSTTQFGSTWPVIDGSGSMTISFPTNTGYLTGSTTNMTRNMPITFSGSIFGGVFTATTYYVSDIINSNTFTIANSVVTVAATATTVTTNVITVPVSTTAQLTTHNPIIFSGTTFGNIVAGTVYYVNKIVNSTTFTVASSLLSRTATATETTSNLITVNDTTGFVANAPIKFTGTAFGGLSSETTYYILAVNNTTSFTISTSPGGSAVNLTNGAGNLIVKTASADFVLSTDTGTMTGTGTSAKRLVTSETGSMTSTVSTALIGGVSAGLTYYVLTVGSGVFTVTGTSGGSTAVTMTNSVGSMNVAAVGWDHIIPGTPIVPALDSSSLYYIEPKVAYAEPAFSQSAVTLISQGSNSYVDVAYGNGTFIAIGGNSAIAARSTNGVSWSSIVMPSASNWKGIAYGNNYWVAVASGTDTVVYSSANGSGWRSATLPASASWNNITYGVNKFVTIATSGSSAAYSTDNGASWTAATGLPSATWTGLCYGAGRFVAVATSGTQAAYSLDGVTWNSATLPGSSTTWVSVAYGNGRFVAVSSTSNATAYSFDGITWYSSNLAIAVDSVAYGQGVFLAIKASNTTAYTSEDGINWKPRTVSSSAIARTTFGFVSSSADGVFVTAGGTSTGTNIFAGVKAKGRAVITSGAITSMNLWEPGSNYTSVPTVTYNDPNNTSDAVIIPRIGNGALGNPSIISKGIGYSLNTTYINITGNGYADSYQVGYTLIANGLSRIPTPGDNLIIAGSDVIYKVTSASIMYGTTSPNIEANIQVSPNITADVSPADGAALSIRTKYSQARLTGHDLLNIGYGNIIDSNYPGVPSDTELKPQNQTVEINYGRVFYTSGDQDGNFKVGNLFGVEQATGIVTLSATQFGLTGLSTLSLGGIAVGGSSVVIQQFSTDQTLAANSDNVISTQRAIKAYVASRLSQGGSNTFTGNLIAGNISVGNPNYITNLVPAGIAGSSIKMPNKIVVNGGAAAWAGDGAALQLFAQSFTRRGNIAQGR